MIAAIDRWAGRVLFLPLIVRFCQWRGITQHVFANHVSWFGGLGLIAYITNNIQSEGGAFWWTMLVIMGLLVFAQSAILAFRPDLPRKSSDFWRRFWLFLTLVEAFYVVRAMFGVDDHTALILFADLMFAITEYARTIDTIPPLEEKKPEHTWVPAKETNNARR